MEEAPIVRNVAIGLLHESPLNPRTAFDAAKLDELAASLRTTGMLQPIVVREHPTIAGSYEVVMGARRLRAARLANLDSLCVVMRDVSDKQVVEMMLVENLQRDDLGILEEGEGYWTLRKAGYTQQRIAMSIGKSASYVSARMTLRDLVPEAKESLIAGQITPSHAILIARLVVGEQRRALSEYATEHAEEYQRSNQVGRMSVREFQGKLRPTRPAIAADGRPDPSHVRITRCWRCNGPLVFDTDGCGKQVEGCVACCKYIRHLEAEVRRLRRAASTVEAP